MCLASELTPRQFQILHTLLDGTSRSDLLTTLKITPKTLKKTLETAARRVGIEPISKGRFNPTSRLIFLMAKEYGLLGAEWPL